MKYDVILSVDGSNFKTLTIDAKTQKEAGILAKKQHEKPGCKIKISGVTPSQEA